MALTAPGSLRDLRPLIFGNHPLKLQHQPLFGRFGGGGFQKNGVHSVTGKLLQQQNLIRVLATEAIGRIDQYHLYLTFRRQVPQTL